jgi:rhamnose utilization protein RhaD (predicted bifunctional aldolase and dehydrogenase)
MIANRWTETGASHWQEAAGADARARELALRVYSSRLIGQDPDLVMHGGGNTSLKATAPDMFGEELRVLHVKGRAGIWTRSRRRACRRCGLIR